ncbi:MAG: hypothetical protein ACXVZZ_11375 [Terriglobales bacterium]
MGSVSIVTAGDVTVQVSGGTPGTSYNVNFCLYPATLYLDNCMTSLTTIVADSSGAGQSTFHFPKSGNWAGIFRVMNGASVFVETSGHKNSFAANVMQMEPQTTTNPQGVGFTGLQDPGTGTLSAQGNGMTHVTLSKAVPNVTYEVIDCYMGRSSCYLAGTVLTDSSGNGASDVEISGPSQAIFRVQRGTDGAAVGFVTGFTVP